MSFLSVARRVALCGITLGGSERVQMAAKSLEKARAAYYAIMREATMLSETLTQMLRSLGSETEFAFHRLRAAERILSPLLRHNARTEFKVFVLPTHPALTASDDCKHVMQEFAALKATAKGTVAGAALGVGSWTAVSLLGSASTGIGIGTLSGVAATNATLAWFGGGSLATGGLGMAGGGIVLGGVVIVPMIGISAWLTHKEATRIQQAVNDIERANETNREAVDRLKDRIQKVTALLHPFEGSVERFSTDVARVQRKLFRFGWLSRLYRSIRYYFRGYYYDPAEMVEVEALANSVQQFLVQFKRNQKFLTAKA